MEAENQQLRQALTQKTSQVKTLESRLTSTQFDLQESQEKVKAALSSLYSTGTRRMSFQYHKCKLVRSTRSISVCCVGKDIRGAGT